MKHCIITILFSLLAPLSYGATDGDADVFPPHYVGVWKGIVNGLSIELRTFSQSRPISEAGNKFGYGCISSLSLYGKVEYTDLITKVNVVDRHDVRITYVKGGY